MGLRFRKSIKIAPGVRLNIGKKSAGVSVGSKYGGFSVNSRTGMHKRVSVPGTGVSFVSKVGDEKHKSNHSEVFEKNQDDIYDDEDSTEKLSLFLDEAVLASLNEEAFKYYSDRVIKQAELAYESEDNEYINKLIEELTLIKEETQRRLEAKNSKQKSNVDMLIKNKWGYLILFALLFPLSILCFKAVSVIVGILSGIVAIYFAILTIKAFYYWCK